MDMRMEDSLTGDSSIVLKNIVGFEFRRAGQASNEHKKLGQLDILKIMEVRDVSLRTHDHVPGRERLDGKPLSKASSSLV